MNKEIVIKLLQDCLSSNQEVSDREKLQEVVNLLENVREDVNQLKGLSFDMLKDYCQINDEEIQELSFYKLICEIQEEDYQLTTEQISRIKDLTSKMLREVTDKIKLFDKNLEKDNYLRRIIDKLSCEKFILKSDELREINNFLKDKNVDILQINQIMVMLSVEVISELERQLKSEDLKIDDNEQIGDVQDVIDEKEGSLENNNVLGKDEYIYKLDNILAIYNYLELRGKIVNDIDNLMNLTTIDDIEYILKTINGLGKRLNDKIVMEMIYHSSKEIVEKVLKITSKLSGKDEDWCFSHLCEHVSIFIKEGKNSSYQDFIRNMYMFDELNLTKDEFMLLNIETLCIEHKKLKKNVLTLEKYQIPRTSYLEMVSVLKSSTNLYDELDTWLELGNNESRMYLENRLSILVTNRINNFKNKFRILRNLGLSITINDTNKSLNKWLFEELDLMSSDGSVNLGNKRYYNANFIPYVIKNEEYEKILRKREIDSLEDKTINSKIFQIFVNNVECINNLFYRIPGIGIKISKNKVQRVFNTLISNGITESREILIYAITYNSAINEEEYRNICNYVDEILGNTLEHKGSVR